VTIQVVYPPPREEARFLKEAREILDEKRFAAAWEAGSRMSFHEAAAFGSECLAAGPGESDARPVVDDQPRGSQPRLFPQAE
jgi:hypothetical protein